MKYDIKKEDCKTCPKCGMYNLDWTVCWSEELLYFAECPKCGMFFANELSNFQVEDDEF